MQNCLYSLKFKLICTPEMTRIGRLFLSTLLAFFTFWSFALTETAAFGIGRGLKAVVLVNITRLV